MKRTNLNRRMPRVERLLMRVALLLVAVAVVFGTSPTKAADPFSGEGGNRVTSGFKKGIGKVADFLTPEEEVLHRRDNISVFDKSEADPDLCIAVARLAEESGNMAGAEENYRKAVALNPNRIDCVLGYARFKDRQGHLKEATDLYRRALQLAPNQGSLYNDLGLCFARQGNLSDSITAIQDAISLEPKRALYRNNLATIFVELGRENEAFSQLRAVHEDAVAEYNLGYLLYKKGNVDEAARRFQAALQKNPQLEQAKAWLVAIQAQKGGTTRTVPIAQTRAAAPRAVTPPPRPAPVAPAVATRPPLVARHAAVETPQVRPLPPVPKSQATVQLSSSSVGKVSLGDAPLPPPFPPSSVSESALPPAFPPGQPAPLPEDIGQTTVIGEALVAPTPPPTLVQPLPPVQ